MVAVTVTVPAAEVSSTSPLTVAPVVPALWTLQVMAWFVAPAGATVPLKVRGWPAVAVVGTPVMPVTATNDAIVMESGLVTLPAEFVAPTVKLNVPAAEGVPEIVPVEVLMDKPPGNAPALTLQLIGAVPVASRAWL